MQIGHPLRCERPITTRALVSTILFVVILLNFVGAEAAVLKRKNIDDLTVPELEAYEHAIQILMDRSAKDPYDKTGYTWQAWVHNCPFIWRPRNPTSSRFNGQNCDRIWRRPGPGYDESHPGVCEHGKDLFLPWHRAQF